jgi:FtsZ-binding cell division protein ZapB
MQEEVNHLKEKNRGLERENKQLKADCAAYEKKLEQLFEERQQIQTEVVQVAKQQ